MKQRWPEILQLMLCFFWIPSFIEKVFPNYIRGPQAILYLLWAVANTICGGYYIWIEIVILAVGAYAIHNLIKSTGNKKNFGL